LPRADGASGEHFVLDKVAKISNARSGIITNKSKLGTMAESLFPELSSPFEMSSAAG